ncbi:MAG: hypothetical protein JWM68_755, partial [Verrucomicrobiales bacterium]|nr:hypothetical protein [Verrucomicrobiales bacterium]
MSQLPKNRTDKLMTARFHSACLFLAGLLIGGMTASGVTNQVDTAYLHHAWQFDEGLPQNSVQAALQTRDGYVWAATPKGLARFDGMTFTVFDPQNVSEFKNTSFTAFCETKDGSLWIGTDGGLNRLKDGTFYYYSREAGFTNDQVRSLFEDKDGALWIGTTKGVSQYKAGKFSNFTPEQWPPNEAVRSICQDQNGTMWFATGMGVFRWGNNAGALFNNKNTGSWGTNNWIPNNSIRSVYCDRQGNVWLGSNRGLTLFEEGKCITFSKDDGLADHIVSSIFEDRSGNLWIGSYGGLNRMKQAGHLKTSDPNFRSSISFYKELNAERAPYDAVNSISQDHEGSLWIGAKDGLSRIKNRDFTAYTQQEGLTHNNVTSVCEDSTGTLWIGTWGGGLNRYANGLFTNYSGDLVLGICVTADMNVWFGTDYDGGLFRLQDGKPIHMDFPDAAIKALHEDRKGNLWIGTATALDLLRDGQLTRFTTTNGLPSNMVRTILEDHQGNIWLGTGNGLAVRKDGRFISFTTTNGLSSNAINSLYEDRDHTLWIGTLTGGL